MRTLRNNWVEWWVFLTPVLHETLNFMNVSLDSDQIKVYNDLVTSMLIRKPKHEVHVLTHSCYKKVINAYISTQ